MAAAPRCGSPLIGVGELRAANIELHPDKPKAAATASAMLHLVRITVPGRRCIAGLQPGGKQRQARGDVNDSRWNPHDEPAELLILQGSQSPRKRLVAVPGIPD